MVSRKKMRRACRSLLIGALLLSTGCFHSGIRPRTADILGAGEVSAGVNLTVATLEMANIEQADGDSFEAFSGWRSVMHPLAAIYTAVLDSQAYVSVGFADGAEVSALLGYQELGGEVRAALFDEDRGGGASVAVSAAATWRPFMDAKTPYFRAGVDVSKRSQRIIPIAGLYASFGPETHAVILPDRLTKDCKSFGQPGCGEYGPMSHFLYTRNEFRLHTTLGMAVRFAEEVYNFDTPQPLQVASGHRLTFGVVPYATLWSQPSGSECVGCDIVPGHFDSDWGMHVTVAYDYFPDDEVISE